MYQHTYRCNLFFLQPKRVTVCYWKVKQGGFDALDKYPGWFDDTSGDAFYGLPCYEYPNMIKVNISSVLLFLFPFFLSIYPFSLFPSLSLFFFPSLPLLLRYFFNPSFLILSSPSLPHLPFPTPSPTRFSTLFLFSPLSASLLLFFPSPTSYLSFLPYLSLPFFQIKSLHFSPFSFSFFCTSSPSKL